MTEQPVPAVDQIWQDNDPRSPDRYLLIIDTDASRATVRQVSLTAEGAPVILPGVRATRIRLDRFTPTSSGYRYVAPPVQCPAPEEQP